MKLSINVFNVSSFKYLPKKRIFEAVNSVFEANKIKEGNLNLIICSDEFIHDLNKKYLEHDYPTDVITFIIEDEPLDAEIYISADTALKQSVEYNVTLRNEILRLAIHGSLHIAGFEDNTDEERKMMGLEEDKFLLITK
jgi:rRNA maturation RNase YbeY